jgi:hypothetical protein
MKGVRAFTLALILVLVSSTPGSSQAPACGFVDLGAPIPPSERTRILVLGSQHLRRIDTLDPATLDPLLDALEEWGPTAIGVEVLPPRVIASMEARPVYGPALEAFATEQLTAGRLARDHLGVTWSEAMRAADSLYAELGAAPPDRKPALRRELVPVLLAAYDLDNAALQWAYGVGEHGDQTSALTDTLRTIVESRLEASNETAAIGLALARRLRLPRVHPIDDHTETDLFLAIADDLASQLQGSDVYRELVESGELEKSESELREAHEAGDLLPFYLELNAPETLALDVDLEWKFFFRTDLPSGLDRYRVALWEVRNLAMASHVRRMTAPIPGERALVIVGASHKPFLDANLSCGMDIEIVHLHEVVDRQRCPEC